MSAPNLVFSVSGTQISDESGFNYISVTFSADAPYQAFECRATKLGEDWGLGKGVLVASFSQTPARTPRRLRFTMQTSLMETETIASPSTHREWTAVGMTTGDSFRADRQTQC